jgi:hypothetical protein
MICDKVSGNKVHLAAYNFKLYFVLVSPSPLFPQPKELGGVRTRIRSIFWGVLSVGAKTRSFYPGQLAIGNDSKHARDARGLPSLWSRRLCKSRHGCCGRCIATLVSWGMLEEERISRKCMP